MTIDIKTAVNARHAEALATFPERIRESERFHMKEGKVHQTLESVAKHLAEAKVDYTIVGGMALNAHGYLRETTDVDILVTPDGLRVFTEQYVGKGYRPAFEGARKSFRNTITGVKVEFLTTGEYPGDGKPKPVVFPDPAAEGVLIDNVQVIKLPRLIELKLASGMSNSARRRDLADVQDLIKHLGLDKRYAAQLNPYVQEMFLELVAEVQSDPRTEE